MVAGSGDWYAPGACRYKANSSVTLGAFIVSNLAALSLYSSSYTPQLLHQHL